MDLDIKRVVFAVIPLGSTSATTTQRSTSMEYSLHNIVKRQACQPY